MTKRILVVDDEPDIVQLIASRLRSNGFEIESAFDGEEALKKARSAEFDLIVLDVMMPKVDGYEVCASLKRDERFARTPVLLLSARAGRDDQRIGLEDCGADAYLTKPFNPKAFVEKVLELLR